MENQNDDVSVLKVVFTFVIGCLFSGVAIYLVRTLLWGKLISELLFWINEFDIPTLLFIVGIVPLGGFLLWMGGILPVTIITSVARIIVETMNKNKQRTIEKSLIGIGAFNIIGSVAGLFFWIYILVCNQLDFWIIISFICVVLQFIIGMILFKNKPSSN